MNRPRVARLLAPVSIGALLASMLIVPVGASAAPPAGTPGAEVSAAVHHDISPPLRTMGPSAPSAATLRERPLRTVGGQVNNGPDGALQMTAGPAVATTAGLSFAGVGQGDYGFSDQYAPPDTNGAVGTTQYVQWVNTAFAVFDKGTGSIASGFPKAGNAVWAGFGGGCQTNNDGDPIVQYDKFAQRWILTQFSVSTTPYLQCVAVSTTSDATGSYYRYSFSYGSTQFPDYPKLGVWSDGYYITYNIFNNGSTWAGAKACSFDRNKMLTGAAATQVCFQLSTAYGGLLPSDLGGTNAPPAGSPDFFLSYGSNSLNLWQFHVDFATPTSSTFTGPVSIPVATFSAACNGGGTCIPQPGTSQKLDSLADRLMYRLAYRNFGDHETLVVNHSVTAGSSVGIRWYELRNASGFTMASATPVVFQQGTYAPDSAYRWMGSIAMDKFGDIAVGYSVSSSSINPSIRYAGRVPTDTLSTLQAETGVKVGGGSQLQNLSRWGDYSAMTIDPVDDCTFWYTNEYLKTSGTFNWSTWITSFSFPGCVTTATAPGAPLNLAATAGNASVGLTWQAPTSNGGSPITGYNVYRGTSSGGEGATPLNTTLVSGTSYTDNTAANGTGYWYTVKAVNSVGTGPASNEASATPTGTANAPSAPLNLAATAPKGGGVQLSWQTPTSNGGAAITGYKVYRGTSAGGEDYSNPIATLGAGTSYTDTTTARRTTYYYTVKAVNSAGTSQPSNEASARSK